MKDDEQKSRSQLVTELGALRQQLDHQESLKVRVGQLEKALETSETNLRSFMENARGFGVYSVEPDENEAYGTKNIFVSPSVKDILGIEDPENNTSWFQTIHPDDVERVTAAHYSALEDSNEFDETLRVYHQRKQEWRWLRAISSKVTVAEGASIRFNGMIVDVTDIKRVEEILQKGYEELEIRIEERTTDLAKANEMMRMEIEERRQAEKALLQSQEQLQRYIAAIDDIGLGLCVINADHSVALMNKTLIRWFGDHRGKSCHWAIMGQKRPCTHCKLSVVVEQGNKVRYYPSMADGRTLEIVAAPIYNSDGTVSKMEIIRDITEQKAQEEQRLETSRQKEQLKKLASLKNMAGAIAHRFNNAMTGVQGNLELMTINLPEDSDEYRMAINALHAARGASQVGFMMLSYVEQKPLQLKEVALADFVRETVRGLKTDFQPSISLKVVPADQPLYCSIDPLQIKEVVKSIVMNAVESMDNNSGLIEISLGMDYVAMGSIPLIFQGDDLKSGVYAFCQIKDSGHGISPENIQEIFEPFYTTRFVGRGLGLAMSVGIMQAHRGAITIESIPDQGTTVRVLLPSISSPSQHTPLSWDETEGEAGQLSGNILLADDEPIVLIALKMMLEEIGFTVHTAANGQEAVNMVRNQDNNFSAVVLDVLMPEMDGIEAMQEIRKVDHTLPVLLLSGCSRDELSIQEDHKNSPDAFMVKPVQRSVMRNRLEMLLLE